MKTGPGGTLGRVIEAQEGSAAVRAADDWWLRALPGGERPVRGRPDWAAFVDRVLAAVPPSPPVDDLAGPTGFEAVLSPFAEAAAERIPAGSGTGPVDLAAVRAEFVRRLTATLARRSARTLVLELDSARRRGGLAGDTPSERFRSFTAMTACQDGLSALLAEYPVLARLLGQTCLHAAEAMAELLGRFEADRAEIVAVLLGGTDPGALVGVASGAGDGHRRGRSVAVLRFADGRHVVYKPRSLRAHRHFNEVVDWFNARPGTPDLPVVSLLDRGGYGWVEHIAHLPCGTGRRPERFYRRQGALLALLHAVDGTDLHHENLIARGDEPVLIDVETLFHPPPAGRGADDPAAAALQASVHRTGLLPHLLLGDRTAVDASGLGGDAGAPLSTDAVTWADAGTDRMRLVRRPQTLTGAANRPVLAGVAAEPAAYTEALLDGFRAGYRAVAAGRDELLGPRGPLARFADSEVRVVVRPTQTYATLLAESTHPDVLRDAAQRDALFRLLGTDGSAGPGHPGVLDHEIAQLWDGDVPLFTTRPGSVDLWSGDGVRIPGALDRTGLDRVAERLRAMGEADLAAQQWIVRAAMAARSTAAAHAPAAHAPAVRRPAAEAGPGEPEEPGAQGGSGAPGTDPERLLDAARRIGDLLLASAHRGPERTNWLGLELIADRYWQLRPCGADLGGGYSGVALFLARLAALTGEERYAEAAVRALAPLPPVLERLAARPQDLAAVGPGGFAGLGGIAYAVTAVAALGDPGPAGLIGPAVDLTVLAAGAERAPGVAEGLAGGLAALLAVHRATGSAGARHGARVCAARLAALPLPAEPGFATGAAGVGWALLGFAEAAGDVDCERAGLAALRTAADVLAADVPAADHGSAGAWCRGRVGVALAVADRPVAAGDAQLAELLARTVRSVDARPGPLPDHSPCHGESGVLELLARPADPAARAARDRWARRLVAALERRGPRCGTPAAVAVPGVLTGLAGVGHGLLRLGFPERTPSVLLLQAPTP